MVDSDYLVIERLTSIDALVIATGTVDWACFMLRHCSGGR
jgi:hypothetical protein